MGSIENNLQALSLSAGCRFPEINFLLALSYVQHFPNSLKGREVQIKNKRLCQLEILKFMFEFLFLFYFFFGSKSDSPTHLTVRNVETSHYEQSHPAMGTLNADLSMALEQQAL